MFVFFKNKFSYNSFAIIFLLFLYSLAALPGVFLNTGLIIIALTILLIAPVILKNISRSGNLYIKALFVFSGLLLYLFYNYIAFPEFAEATTSIIVSFGCIGLVGILCGCLQYDENLVIKYGRYLALINFVPASLLIFVSSNIFALSMRFGYAMLPSTIWFLFEIVRNKKIWFIPLFIISILMLAIYGSRGTLLVIGIYVALTIIKYKKIPYIILLFFLYIFREQILDIVLDFLITLSDLTGAHKIRGLISVLSGDLVSTTGGRDELYQRCWDIFNQNLWGAGVCFYSNDPIMAGVYPHNVFFQIAAESGLPGLIIFIVVIVKVLMELFSISKDKFQLYAIFFSIAIGRLLVSSNYWERPEFWLAISIFLINKLYRNKITNCF